VDAKGFPKCILGKSRDQNPISWHQTQSGLLPNGRPAFKVRKYGRRVACRRKETLVQQWFTNAILCNVSDLTRVIGLPRLLLDVSIIDLVENSIKYGGNDLHTDCAQAAVSEQTQMAALSSSALKQRSTFRTAPSVHGIFDHPSGQSSSYQFRRLLGRVPCLDITIFWRAAIRIYQKGQHHPCILMHSGESKKCLISRVNVTRMASRALAILSRKATI